MCAKLESRMTHITGFERDQLPLLPEAVDDYVEADNPAQFIDAFVEGLALADAEFARPEAMATGWPCYGDRSLPNVDVAISAAARKTGSMSFKRKHTAEIGKFV